MVTCFLSFFIHYPGKSISHQEDNVFHIMWITGQIPASFCTESDAMTISQCSSRKARTEADALS